MGCYITSWATMYKHMGYYLSGLLLTIACVIESKELSTCSVDVGGALHIIIVRVYE